jgi:hypothetical protein
VGFLDRLDRRNQDTLDKHNRRDKELISKGAERILAWSLWIPLILLAVALVVVGLAQVL